MSIPRLAALGERLRQPDGAAGREGIHLVGLGGMDPLQEYKKLLAEAFGEIHLTIEERVEDTFSNIGPSVDMLDLERVGVGQPSATWTYLVHDRALNDLMLTLQGNYGVGAVAWIMTGPLLAAWGLWRRWRRGADVALSRRRALKDRCPSRFA